MIRRQTHVGRETESGITGRAGLRLRRDGLRRWRDVALWLVRDEVVVVGENDRSRAISQIQLGEDMVDVGLHRTFTDEELLGDLGVCAASTDQSEDLEFALGELVEYRSGKCGGGWGVAVDGEDSAGHCGVEPCVTGGNGSYRSIELVSGHTFEDESGRPGAQHPGERFVVVECGESENWKARPLCSQQRGGGDAVEAWHADVHEHDVGIGLLGGGECLASVGALTGDLEAEGLDGRSRLVDRPSGEVSDIAGGYLFLMTQPYATGMVLTLDCGGVLV